MIQSRYYQIWLNGVHVMDVYSYSARRAKQKALPDLLKSGYKNIARAKAV